MQLGPLVKAAARFQCDRTTSLREIPLQSCRLEEATSKRVQEIRLERERGENELGVDHSRLESIRWMHPVSSRIGHRREAETGALAFSAVARSTKTRRSKSRVASDAEVASDCREDDVRSAEKRAGVRGEVRACRSGRGDESDSKSRSSDIRPKSLPSFWLESS